MRKPLLALSALSLMLSIATACAEPQPVTAAAEDLEVLQFELPGILIGSAAFPDGPTGTTVFHFPDGVAAASDIRGGSVGATGAEFGFLNALSFSGGSLFGLEVPSGIRAELLERADNQVRWDTIPLVAGAIIWDFNQRKNAVYPNMQLGRAALRSAKAGRFVQGRAGAGIAAAVGQGAAYRQVGDLRIAVFTVVNALGRVVDRGGNTLTHDGVPAIEALEQKLESEGLTQALAPAPTIAEATQHTTLTLVAINARDLRLEQIALQVHTSMARAIQPFHTEFDGDILWAVTTNKIETSLNTTEVGLIASEVAWDAVLNAVTE